MTNHGIYSACDINRVVIYDPDTNSEYPWVGVESPGRYSDSEVGTDLREVWVP